MSIEISPKSFFQQPSVADMRLIACPGAEELTGLIDKHLVRWAKDAGIDKETFIISCDCPRFQSGDAKGLVKESVRGDDIFIVVDPGNYSVTYKLFDNVNHMSPDDHFANLKRLIQAVAEGKLTYVVGTNLTYRTPELLTRDWYVDVDVSKYAAYFVVALNHDMSVSSIIDPLKKIEALLAKRA